MRAVPETLNRRVDLRSDSLPPPPSLDDFQLLQKEANLANLKEKRPQGTGLHRQKISGHFASKAHCFADLALKACVNKGTTAKLIATLALALLSAWLL